jgi:lipopolysaccharide transport system permease protein
MSLRSLTGISRGPSGTGSIAPTIEPTMELTRSDPAAEADPRASDLQPHTSPPAVKDTLPVVRIRPSSGWSALRLDEVWHYRELLYFLIWRDVKVRYKQTALGALWAILQPLLTMVVFAIFFGRLADMPSDGVPYPVFAFAALVPWTFFANALSQASNSLVGSGDLLKKVYFPRLIIPLASVLSGLVDFAIAFAVLVAFIATYALLGWYDFAITPRLLLLPLLVLQVVAAALAVALWLSALNVEYRDVRYVVPFLTQLWFFATPVVYPSTLLEEAWQRTLYGLNPMVGVIEGFRWAIVGSGTGPGLMTVVSAVVTVALLVYGAFYFRRLERTFADRV